MSDPQPANGAEPISTMAWPAGHVAPSADALTKIRSDESFQKRKSWLLNTQVANAPCVESVSLMVWPAGHVVPSADALK